MFMRALALLFNAFPVRWQRRFMTAAHERFLVGVTGLGIDREGRVLLARHRFGAPEWRFLGGFLARRERVEDALVREVREETGLAVEIGPVLEVVFAYRVTGGAPVLTEELAELRGFDPAELPDVRADQRGLIERHAAAARAWAMGRG